MSQFRTSTSAGALSRSARAFIGVAACLGGVIAFANPARAGMAAIDPAVAQFEQDYMTFTIDHHTGGVELAELALEKTANDTLRDLNETIRETQTREIGELQGFLSEWYDREVTPMVPPMTQMDLERQSALEGQAFDVDHSQTFIMHHMEIIERSQEVVARAEHEDLRDFAQGVIDTQSAEIPIFASVIAGTDGGATPIPLPPAAVPGAIGLAGVGLAAWWQRRKQLA